MCLKSSLVYKFSCAQRASEYVGMTARTLGTRVDEHVWGQLPNRSSPHSAIRDHIYSCGTHLTPVILKY